MAARIVAAWAPGRMVAGRLAESRAAALRQAGHEIRRELARAGLRQLTFPNADPVETARLRARARAAIVRDAAVDGLLIHYRVLAVNALGITVFTLLLGDALAERARVLAAIPGYAAGYGVSLAVSTLYRWLPEPVNRLLRLLQAVLPATLLWALHHDPRAFTDRLGGRPFLSDPALAVQFLLGYLVFPTLVLAIEPARWAAERYRERFAASRPGSTPYDRLIRSWVRTVNELAERGPRWPSHAAIEACSWQLTLLSRAVRSELPLRRVAWGAADRRRLTTESERVRAALLAHRSALLSAGAGAPYTALLDSLREGLAALLVGDRARLLANLPVPSARAWLRNLLKRVFPGLVLAAAGIGLPLIPAVAHQAELAGNLRVTLLVTAVLGLISAPEGVTGPIDTALAKTLSWKRD